MATGNSIAPGSTTGLYGYQNGTTPINGGNVTVNNLTVTFNANIGNNLTVGNTVTTSNVITGNIYTDGYYYANGAPFIGQGGLVDNAFVYVRTMTDELIISGSNAQTATSVIDSITIPKTGYYSIATNLRWAGQVDQSVFSIVYNVTDNVVVANTLFNMSGGRFQSFTNDYAPATSVALVELTVGKAYDLRLYKSPGPNVTIQSDTQGQSVVYVNSTAGVRQYTDADVANYLNGNIAGNIIPFFANSQSLGNAGRPWGNVYVSNVTIDNNSITSNGPNVEINGSPIVLSAQNGDIFSTGNIYAVGNLTGNYVLGNGFFLTDVGGGSNYSNTNVSAYLITITSNIGSVGFAPNAIFANSYYYGNGDPFTGGGGTNYSNANVANYLLTSSGNIGSVGSAPLAIFGSEYFYANGDPFITSDYGNANVADFLSSGNLATDITTTASITAFGNVVADDYVIGNIIVGNTINANTISVTGNTTANFFIGNGSQLTGLPATYSNADVFNYLGSNSNVNIVTTGNVTADFFIGDGSLLSNIDGGNIIGGYGNSNVANYLPTYTGNMVSLTGDVITQANVFGNNLRTIGNVYTDNISGANNVVALNFIGNTATFTGNVGIGGNLNVIGNINYSNISELVVGDSLIQIAANNTTNLLDIGFFGQYNTGSNVYTGLARDYLDGSWKLFDNLAQMPQANDKVNFGNSTPASFSAGVTSLSSLNYPWSNTVSFPANATVLNGNTLYRSNGNILPNVGFTVGTTANTWRPLEQFANPPTTYYVDAQAGNDSFVGSFEYPFKTFARLLLQTNLNTGAVVYIKPGTYSENVTWDRQNVNIVGPGFGSLANLTGTWSFTHPSSSVRVSGCSFNQSVTLSGNGNLYFSQCQVNGISKTGTGFLQTDNCDINATLSVTGPGFVNVNQCKVPALTMNNANAVVTMDSSESSGTTGLIATSGTLGMFNCQLTSATANGNCINATATSYVVLDSCIVSTAAGALGRVSLGGLYSLSTTNLDRANSVLSIQNAQTVDISDNFSAINTVNANVFTGNTANIFGNATLAGNIRMGNIFVGGYFFANGAPFSGGGGGNGTSITNGNTNINIPVANGNITIQVANIAYGQLDPTNIVIGANAGNANNTNRFNVVTLGNTAGNINQGDDSVAIGTRAAFNTQGNSSIAIGINSGQFSQGDNSIALGNTAGNLNQSGNSIAIGAFAGRSNQGLDAIAMGVLSGTTSQGFGAVGIGFKAGESGQNANGVAIGYLTGSSGQGQNSVAIGPNSGQNTQGQNAVAIGHNTAQNNQGNNAVAIGSQSGNTTQGTHAVAIGRRAGQTTQGTGAIAIGDHAGNNNQGNHSIAIGAFAGNSNQVANSIVISAGNVEINPTNAGFYVNPIRQDNTFNGNIVYYNPTTDEVTYNNLYVTETGESVLTGTINIAASQTVDILTFTLPSAGVWDVNFITRAQTSQTGVLGVTFIRDSANAIISNSETLNQLLTLGGSNTYSFFQATSTGTTRITTTGAATYKLSGLSTTGSGTVTVVSDNNGRTKVSWQKISGFAPATGNSTSYLTARLTSAQTGVTNGSDIVWNQQIANSSGITLNTTTGVFTLQAGITYNLMAVIATDSFSDTVNGFLSLQWVDATTNTAIASLSQGIAVPINRNANEMTVPICQGIYTPSTNQTIKVRCTNSTGNATVRAGLQSYAQIAQIGTTNTTGFTGVVSPNWNINNTYPAGTIVVNNGTMYQANDLIPAGTAFTLGTTGATWAVINGNDSFNMAAVKSGDQTLSSGQFTVLTGWTNTRDTGGRFNTTTGVYTVPVNGWYTISLSGRSNNATWTVGSTEWSLAILNNSGGVIAQNTNIAPASGFYQLGGCVTTTAYFTAGQTIRPSVYFSATAAAYQAQSSNFSVARVG